MVHSSLAAEGSAPNPSMNGIRLPKYQATNPASFSMWLLILCIIKISVALKRGNRAIRSMILIGMQLG